MIERARAEHKGQHKATIALLLAFSTLTLIVSCAGSPPPAKAAAPEAKADKLDLAQLIAAGDTGGIKTYFANQEQLNTPDSEGYYPLHRAVDKDSPEITALLLALGAKPDVRDPTGKSPLLHAVDGGYADCAKVLAGQGADLFLADAKGIAAADSALARGGDMIAAVFNEKNVNNHDAKGKSALLLAADGLYVDAVNRFLAMGADPTQKDADGHTPLDMAFLHPDRIEAAQIAEALVVKGSTTQYDSFAWFVQAAKAVDYNSVRFTEGSTPLHEAVFSKEKGFTLFLLSRKAAPNAHDSAGNTPLHVAIREGWLEGAEMLLKAGADPNARDGFDNTPLHIAMPQGAQSGGVSLLLKYKADLSLKDRNGNTPLHVAVQLGYPVAIIQELIDAKAPVNGANATGDTALMLALRGKRYDYAKPLQDAGADIFLVNAKGESALSIAIAQGSAALDAILTPTTIKGRDNYGNNCVAIAVGLKAGPDVIALLLAKGADPNSRNNAGDTPLHLAVRQDLREQGEALLLAKVDIFASNEKGETPLSLALAADGGPIEWMFSPSTVVLKDSNGDTILHYAAKQDLYKAIPFLVGKGAAIDAADNSGETPLHQAVKSNAIRSVQELLKLGASASARDAMSNTPLHDAVLWGSRSCMEVLIAGGAAIDPRDAAGETPLYLSVRKNNKSALEFLLGKGADPNARDTDGVSPLAAAVKIGSGDLARTLLAAGADPNTRDAMGRTPLIEAIDSKNSDLAQFLVASGCDILARDADGDSPLTLALKRGDSMLKLILTPKTANLVDPNGISCLRTIVDSKAPLAVVELALTAGSRVDGRDRYGDTVLHAALRNGQLDVAARLIKAGADVFSNNANGKSPASIAMAQGADSIKAVFQASGIGIRDKLGNTILHFAAMTNDAKTVELALSLGADRSAKNIAGETASDIAAKRGYADLAALLVPGSATVPATAPAATADPPDTQTAPANP